MIEIGRQLPLECRPRSLPAKLEHALFRTITITLILFVSLPLAAQTQGPAEVAETLPDEASDEPTISCQSFVPPEELHDAQRAALRGVACFEERQFIQALRHYRRAFEVSESPLLMGAIGRVFQELGYPALAREYYKSYLLAKTDRSGEEKIASRLDDVEKELAENAVPTRIETDPPGARVYFVIEKEHWELAGESPVEMQLLPGSYDIVIRRDGFVPTEETLVVRERTSPENITGNSAVYELADPQAVFETSGREWRERGIATTIVAIPFVAAGATMIAIGMGKETDAVEISDPMMRDDINGDASMLKTWGAASLAVGATGLVVGGVFYLLGLDGSDDGPSDEESSPSPTVDAQGLLLRF